MKARKTKKTSSALPRTPCSACKGIRAIFMGTHESPCPECVDGCHGCRHLQCSGYSFWCSKEGCKCTRGAVPEQDDCFEPNVQGDSQSPAKNL